MAPPHPAPSARRGPSTARVFLHHAAGMATAILNMGECIVTARPMCITTVLGSCVAATFHHGPSGLAAMFHAMLPERQRHGSPGSACRFVDSSVHGISERFLSRRIALADVTVKLFGGALTFRLDPGQHPRLDVGRQNVLLCRRLLQELGYGVECEDVLGNVGRKLFFWTTTGEVWLRRLGQPVVDAGPS